MRLRKVTRQAIDVVEITIRFILVLLLELVLVESVVVKGI